MKWREKSKRSEATLTSCMNEWRLKLEPQCACIYQGIQSKDNDTNWQQNKRLRKRRIFQCMKTHALASTTLTCSQVLQVTSHIAGFRSVLRVVNFNLCRCDHFLLNFDLYAKSLYMFTRRKRVLKSVVFTLPVGCRRPTSALNDPIAIKYRKNKTNSWKPFVLGFIQRPNTTGFSVLSFNLCMRPHLSTFFELLWIPPRTTPLPPTGGRTRWWVPFLVLLVGHGPELSFSRFLV